MAQTHLTTARMRQLGRAVQAGLPLGAKIAQGRRRARIRPVVLPPDGRAREASVIVMVDDWWGEWSKNGAWRKRRDGRIYLSTPARLARERLASLVAMAAGPTPWPAQKTWLAITVWRPSARADAINCLDGVADAVKRAIKLDDVWYAVRWLDFATDPERPRIKVQVIQEAAE